MNRNKVPLPWDDMPVWLSMVLAAGAFAYAFGPFIIAGLLVGYW